MTSRELTEPYKKGLIFMACCREDAGSPLENVPRPVKVYDYRESQAHKDKYEYYVYFGGYNARLADWYPSEALRAITDEEKQTYAKEIGFLGQTDKEFLPRNIDKVVISQYVMCPWYFSPLPEEFSSSRTLYVCEYCFSMMNSERTYKRHISRCTCRSPPGDLIYCDDEVCFFEVNGSECTNYCRNICLTARLFLQHKTLVTDVDVFLFYIMYAKTNRKKTVSLPNAGKVPDCEPEVKKQPTSASATKNAATDVEDDSYHFVGFFSKEKQQENSLSCIVTLPCFQKRGYGSMMIEFSYMLSSRECRLGGPEMPLSDLGLMSYLSYWKRKICEVLVRTGSMEISLLDISRQTMISYRNLIMVMNRYNLLAETPSSTTIYFPDELADELRACLEKEEKRGIHHLDDKYLHWIPYPNMCYEYRS